MREAEQLADAVAELSREIRKLLVEWGPRGLLVRLVIITAMLEIVFVLIPWLWSRS